MKKQYDLLVFIGRFQPFHNGHKAVVNRALELADHVLVLVGGRNQPRTTRNPWTFEERKTMIKLVYGDLFKPSWEVARSPLNILPLDDHTYNDDAWIQQVQQRIDETVVDIWGIRNKTWGDYDTSTRRKIGLIGCEKDGTSYYLKLFPSLLSENVSFVDPLNATDIRNNLFEGFERFDTSVLPYELEDEFLESEAMFPEGVLDQLVNQYQMLQHYRQSWGEGPFLTADTLVECGGHILVVERGGPHGAGSIALPGGFVHNDETFLHAAIRELREETRLKVPEPVLKGSIVAVKTFDSPHRDERARIVTVCHHIRLTNELRLPQIKGSDDAVKAFWLPISQIASTEFFADHQFIIRKMLSV